MVRAVLRLADAIDGATIWLTGDRRDQRNRPLADRLSGRAGRPDRAGRRWQNRLHGEPRSGRAGRLVSRGAVRVDRDSYTGDTDFVVLADTEGNLFCVIDLTHPSI